MSQRELEQPRKIHCKIPPLSKYHKYNIIPFLSSVLTWKYAEGL